MSATNSRPALIARTELGLSTPYEVPEGELEILVAGIFAEVFDVDTIGANDDFFDIGGDSLVAETLSLAISEQTGRDFQLSALVEHGSPRKIVALLTKKLSKTDAATVITRPPIFIVHGRDGLTFPSPEFRRALADDQKLYMFELPGIRGIGHCYERIEDIASVYVSELEQTYQEGPIFLASFCMGALIALEMAAQLAKKGRPIRQLVLLDPGIPKNPLKTRAFKSRTLGGSLRRLLPWSPVPSNNSQEALTNKYRLRLEQKVKEGRLTRDGRVKRPGLQLSVDAQAKLRAAYKRYRPIPFHGSVTVLASRDRESILRDPTTIWSETLPQRKIVVVMEHHSDLRGSSIAHHMQKVFDAARRETERQDAAVGADIGH
jgi:thioesterase domain-containing protein/acyl carrier protein